MRLVLRTFSVAADMREMKISGVDWCHTIPDNWSIIPSKYLFRDSNVRRLDGDIQLTASQKYGIISQVDYMEREQVSIVLANKGLESWKHVEPLDFIISLRSFQGGLEMSEVKGCITWHYVVLKATQAIHHAYYKWLFKSAQYITALQRTCNFIRDGQDLRYSNFAKVPLPYPPVEEQKTIANFLDNKCAEIDALMEDIRAEISTLEEYKKSVITEAVTKGLNPDAEMKDSGIAWVGKCPEHWHLKKGKYLLNLQQKPVLESDGVITCFRDGEVTLRSKRREEGFTIAEKEHGYQGVDTGDLVVHGMDGFAGAIGISDSRGKASPVLNVLDTEQDKLYVMFYLRSMAYGNIFLAMATGIRVRSCDLRWNKLAELRYPVPPLHEQKEISSYLVSKCAEIDSTISDKQEQLAVLEEFKKSLIYEYVTGKKEVPTL